MGVEKYDVNQIIEQQRHKNGRYDDIRRDVDAMRRENLRVRETAAASIESILSSMDIGDADKSFDDAAKKMGFSFESVGVEGDIRVKTIREKEPKKEEKDYDFDAFMPAKKAMEKQAPQPDVKAKAEAQSRKVQSQAQGNRKTEGTKKTQGKPEFFEKTAEKQQKNVINQKNTGQKEEIIRKKTSKNQKSRGKSANKHKNAPIYRGFSEPRTKTFSEKKPREKIRKTYTYSIPVPECTSMYNGSEAEYRISQLELSLSQRSLFCFMLLALLLVFAFFPQMIQFAAEKLFPSETALCAFALLVIPTGIAILTCIDIIISGIADIFRFRMGWETMAALSVICTVGHNAFVFFTSPADMLTTGFYNASAVFALWLCINSRMQQAKFAKSNLSISLSRKNMYTVKRVTCRQVSNGTKNIAAMRKTGFISSVISNAYEPAQNSRAAYAVTPIILLIIGLASAACYILLKIPVLYTLSMMLAIASPAAMGIASGIPMVRFAKRMRTKGAAVGGISACEKASQIEAVTVKDIELFPKGTVTITGMKMLDETKIDKVVEACAAIFTEISSPICHAFTKMVDGEAFERVDAADYEEGMGVTGRYRGVWYLAGSRELMRKYNVWVPPDNYEGKAASGGSNVLFVAANGFIAAIFIVKYSGCKVVQKTIKALVNDDLQMLVDARSHDVSAEMISLKQRVLDCPAVMLSKSAAYDISEKTAEKPVIRAGIFGTNPLGIIHAIISAPKLKMTITFNTILQIITMIVGLAIALLMLYTGTPEHIEPHLALLYQIIWTIPVLIVSWIFV